MQSWEVFGLCNIYCAMICAKWVTFSPFLDPSGMLGF